MPRRAVRLGLLMGALCVPALDAGGAEPSSDPSAEFFHESFGPFLAKYCFDCHRGEGAEGEVRLDVFEGPRAVARDHETFDRVLRMLRGGDMPPEDADQPRAAEREAVVRWVAAALAEGDAGGPPNPGCVTIGRLNRAEYANTVRDLLGVAFDTADDFPADDVGYGFDNIGDVLTLPPILMEKYLAAAETISRRAITADRLPPPEEISKHLRQLVTRAYRRPARPEELERLVALGKRAHDLGASYEDSLRLVLQAILVSPHFLFKVELDPPSAKPGTIRQLNPYELAARLSYFLWSSMPDQKLFDQARNGSLRRNLEAQVRRMLADRKSDALVENFAGQWLQLRNLPAVRPDDHRFPEFDESLREAMWTETRMFFAHVMREDRSVLEFIDADYTFVNGRLARHYRIPGVVGQQFRRVSLKGMPRGGVITQASVLAVTSNPTRTSPVKRGKWILENILGAPPPDPPPNVPDLKEDDEAILSGSLRERMERHRADPACAVCHAKMDALGFAMENFDAVGAWRVRDGRFPIDPSGELPDGQTFSGPAELKQILRNSGREDFVRCLTEKMLTYALGRGLEPYDRPTVKRITSALGAGDYKFSTLVFEVARSDPFQQRHVAGSN